MVGHLSPKIMPKKKASAAAAGTTGGGAIVGILSFEVGNAMSRAIHLHRSLSREQHLDLRPPLLSGTFSPSSLLSLARAERISILDRIAALTSHLGRRHCPHHPPLSSFSSIYSDPTTSSFFHLPSKPLLSLLRRMDRLLLSTSALYSDLQTLSDLEHSLNKLPNDDTVRRAYIHKINWQRADIKHLKNISLWNQPFDKVVLMLAQAVCSIRARILPSPSSSSPVPPPRRPFLNCLISSAPDPDILPADDITPPSSSATLGASCLAMHYANIVIIIEKLLNYPHLVGDEARGDLYQMLPTSLRSGLRKRLKDCIFAIYDASLAHDWKAVMEGILGWLGPMAHSMVRWQTERNFEQQQQQILNRENVLLVQTLYFADREKTEEVMCELLVGLNYICRYEHQQNALLDCTSSVDFDECGDWQQMRFHNSPERS